MKAVDILIPVFNGLTYVRDCLDSVLQYSDHGLCNILLLDDCSDSTTQKFLLEVASENENVEYVRNSSNLGFLKNCNAGFEQSKNKWLLLLNSDVIVTKGWLEAMLACGESDPRIAAVNPLTNQASQINVAIPPGCNFRGVNAFLQSYDRHSEEYADIVTGVGFCMMLRRSALSGQGLFDEVYGMGYCEESDLCMRLTTQGHRVVLAPKAYVYHKGKGTFTDRDERYATNRKIFDARWKSEYKRQFAEFSKQNPIAKYRNLLSPTERWDPILGARLTYRIARDLFLEGHYLAALKTLVRRRLGILGFYSHVFKASELNKFGSQGNFTVTYVLHNITVAGGVLSVIQLVNELVKQGVDAKIVALREYPEIYDWQLLARPIIFKSKFEMIDNFPESDLVVATHWTTAPWVRDIVAAKKARKAAYFLQDYEPWFFPGTDKESQQRVRDTFSCVPNKIVKSDWLSGMMHSDGYKTHKIRLGMNLDVFYPRDVKRSSKLLRILAMARPKTPRRGYSDLVESLKILSRKCDLEFEVVLYGDAMLPKEEGLEFTNLGVITEQSKLAELYSSCDVFIDSSVFQGFGRPALEAMACGLPCVVTNVGGVNEYARNGYNCFTVPPSQPEQLSNAVQTLLEDQSLRGEFRRKGIETAAQFCHRREGVETYNYFQSLLGE